MTRNEFDQLLASYGVGFVSDAMWRIAQIVAAYEREQCAKLCEQQDELDTRFRYDYKRAALDCCDAIRARTKT